jgi:hypothetical protein
LKYPKTRNSLNRKNNFLMSLVQTLLKKINSQNKIKIWKTSLVNSMKIIFWSPLRPTVLSKCNIVNSLKTKFTQNGFKMSNQI